MSTEYKIYCIRKDANTGNITDIGVYPQSITVKPPEILSMQTVYNLFHEGSKFFVDSVGSAKKVYIEPIERGSGFYFKTENDEDLENNLKMLESCDKKYISSTFVVE
jgi:S-ribosylhomocysteine lyase LuxS involved in autoinducer biosynthesis